MRSSLIFILILANNFVKAQDWDATCEEATTQAKSDFNNGIMKATSYGLIIADDNEFEQFYDLYLKQEYDIESSDGGCMITESTECYSNTMFDLIKQKYGEDFFTKSRKEAERLYKPKSKKFISKYPEVDEPGIIDLPDEMAEYPGGMTKLFEDVKTKMYIKDSSLDDTSNRTFVQFIINKNGHTSDFIILKSGDETMDSTLLQILEEMPRWKPARHQGKKVTSRIILPFNI